MVLELVSKSMASQLLPEIEERNSLLKEDLPDKAQIAHEILAYLTDHPEAEDTLEGIVEWWLLDRRIRYQTERVKQALSELVEKGLILEQRANDSRVHYRTNQSRCGEIRTLVKQMKGG